MTFSSSRTLPGQGWRQSSASASGDERGAARRRARRRSARAARRTEAECPRRARAGAAARSGCPSSDSRGPRGTRRAPPSPRGRGWWRTGCARRPGPAACRRRARTRRSCSTRSSATCVLGEMSPISSRKRVPPSAASKRPFLRATAPVKAPRSWPNSSDEQQRLDQRAAVDLDERARRSAARRRAAPRRPAPCRCRSRRG